MGCGSSVDTPYVPPNKKRKNVNSNGSPEAASHTATSEANAAALVSVGPSGPTPLVEVNDDADLSSISSTSEHDLTPEVSAQLAARRSNSSSGGNTPKGVRGGRANLTAERSVVIPNAAEDFFEYDDVRLYIDVDLRRRQRIQSRMPPLLQRKDTQGKLRKEQPQPQVPGQPGVAEPKVFTFNDFNVDIDLTLAPITRTISPTTKSGHRIANFFVKNLMGHAARVKCLAIAPGEKEFVSCSIEDVSIQLSALKNGKELAIFTAHQDTVIHASFSSDGRYLATTSRDNTMILWDVITSKQLLTFEHSKVVICCCFSRDPWYKVRCYRLPG